MEPLQGRAQPGDVVRGGNDAGPGLPNECCGGAVHGHRGENGTRGSEVLEKLARENASAPASGVRNEEQERLGVALQPKRLGAGRVGNEFEAVAEPEGLGPLAIRGTEVADEARDDVEVGVEERLQEGARVPPTEEAACVRDPEARAAPVSEPGEVVEVAPVRDRAYDALRLEGSHLVSDGLRDARDRVGAPRDELGETARCSLLRACSRGV